MTAAQRILLIDNFDSFTYNLVYDLESLGCAVEVYRNDTPLPVLLDMAERQAAHFVLSPGPGTPADAGVCRALVRAAEHRFAVLGICLGLQVIVEAFDGKVRAAPRILHGRASRIHLHPHPLFEQLPPTIHAGRYHSLAASLIDTPLRVIAEDDDGTAMAVVHDDARIAGFQFHPESILTPDGRELLGNCLRWMSETRAARSSANRKVCNASAT